MSAVDGNKLGSRFNYRAAAAQRVNDFDAWVERLFPWCKRYRIAQHQKRQDDWDDLLLQALSGKIGGGREMSIADKPTKFQGHVSFGTKMFNTTPEADNDSGMAELRTVRMDGDFTLQEMEDITDELRGQNKNWEAKCPVREPATEIDLQHPLIGTVERELLTEKLYRVLHIAMPDVAEECGPIFVSDSEEFPELQEWVEGDYALLIYDVEHHKVVCEASEFFHTMDINTFSWRG